MNDEVDSGSSGAGRVLRGALLALAPSLITFALEKTVLASVGSRWLLMVAGVIVSASSGGMVVGLVATMTSAALVWWFLIPPVRTLGAADPRYYVSVAIFLAVGYAVSLLHERLRRTTDRLTRVARQNQIFASLIENSLDFIGIADPDGKPIYLNPAGRAMVEMPADVEVGRTQISEYYPPDLRAFAQDEILAAMLARGKWAGETSFRNWRTNARIPVLDTHFLVRDPTTRRVIAMATITRDISTQKAQRDEMERTNLRLAQTTHELVESQRFLQGILDYSPNAIVIKGLDGRYMIVNTAFGALTRLAPDQVRGKNDADLFPAALAARVRANDARALETRRAVVTEESVELDNGQFNFLVTEFPLFGERDRILAVGGIWTDVTKLKELQRLHDEWTSVVAHDLRQPISTILMASEFLPELHDGPPAEREREMIKRIHSAAGSLRRMVDDLLDMSLLDAHRLKLERNWSNLPDLIRETLERLAHVAGIERVHVHADPNLPATLVDPMRLEQVLQNLVSNAIKYGEEDSAVTITVERRANELDIAVTNRGRGIAPDELPLLFNRFMRSRTTRGSGVPGLGLGLYISKGVIEAHGGRLWAESTPGETTTFHVVLPIAAAAREAA